MKRILSATFAVVIISGYAQAATVLYTTKDYKNAQLHTSPGEYSTTTNGGEFDSTGTIGAHTTGIDNRLGELGDSIATLDTWRGTAAASIAELATSSTDYGTQLGSLHGTVDTLQTWRGTAAGTIDTLQTWRGTAAASIYTLDAWRATAAATIADHSTQLGSLHGTVDTLQTWRGTAAASIAALATSVTDYGTQLGSLHSSLDSVESGGGGGGDSFWIYTGQYGISVVPTHVSGQYLYWPTGEADFTISCVVKLACETPTGGNTWTAYGYVHGHFDFAGKEYAILSVATHPEEYGQITSVAYCRPDKIWQESFDFGREGFTDDALGESESTTSCVLAIYGARKWHAPTNNMVLVSCMGIIGDTEWSGMREDTYLSMSPVKVPQRISEEAEQGGYGQYGTTLAYPQYSDPKRLTPYTALTDNLAWRAWILDDELRRTIDAIDPRYQVFRRYDRMCFATQDWIGTLATTKISRASFQVLFVTDPDGPYTHVYNGIDEYTALVFHFDGADADTNITALSGGSWSYTIEQGYANPPQLEADEFKYGVSAFTSTSGGASRYFQVGSYTIGNFGTSDFGIEFWHYLTGNQPSIFGAYDNATGLYCNYSGFNPQFFNGTGNDLISSLTIPGSTKNNWYHVALCKTDGVVSIHVDGALGATTSAAAWDSVNLTANGGFYVGKLSAGGSNANGMIDEFRIVRGKSPLSDPFDRLYISSGNLSDGFTPPTAPYRKP